MFTAAGRGDDIVTAFVIKLQANPQDWLGPTYIGAVLDFFFVGILFYQVRDYYSYFPKDKRWIKTLVALVSILSITKAAISFMSTWNRSIIGFGDARGAVGYSWTAWIEPPAAAVISTTAQTFFIWRCFNMMERNWYLFAALVTLTLSSIGFAVAVAVYLIVDPDNLPVIDAITVPMLITSVVVDIIITVIVVYRLTRSLNAGYSKQTVSTLRRLLSITFESALPPALNQLINLVLFLTTFNESLWHAMLNMLTPRLYVFSLMHTLNARALIRLQAPQHLADHELSDRPWERTQPMATTSGRGQAFSLVLPAKGFPSIRTLPPKYNSNPIRESWDDKGPHWTAPGEDSDDAHTLGAGPSTTSVAEDGDGKYHPRREGGEMAGREINLELNLKPTATNP